MQVTDLRGETRCWNCMLIEVVGDGTDRMGV